MKRYNILIIILFSFAMPMLTYGQGLGCIYDEVADGNAPRRPRLLNRDYTVLPDSFSLRKYCPTPRSQGEYSTCVAWATTYAARTICEAINNCWTDIDSISAEAFAPLFIYKQLETELNCENGTSIGKSLGLLKEKGAPKLSSFDVLCADSIPSELFAEAFRYRIDSYTQLFNNYDPEQLDVNKIAVVKKALCENHPVVFSMNVYESFMRYDENELCNGLWNGLQDIDAGFHAMCVIGYNDNKYGGAFEVLNSWGTDWGSEGFVWIKYDDFVKNSRLAYDVYLKKTVRPNANKTGPVHELSKHSMVGSMLLVGKDGGDFSRVMINDRAPIPYYLLDDEFFSGKRFRLEVSNEEPAWVYVIASDQMNHVNLLFPYASNVSAYLNYSHSVIAIPDEAHEFELDAVAGTDYFCVLYSQEELDIHDIVARMHDAEGSFYQKLRKVLGDLLAPQEDIRYIRNYIGFSAKTNQQIVPLVVEISHKGIDVKYNHDN